ncbi:MAG: serine hydrolase [Alphaproteobacteria bacterium]|nr:serine hydrolase [Alphaproteobacteria bacterium]
MTSRYIASLPLKLLMLMMIALGPAMASPAHAQRGNPRMTAGGQTIDAMIADFMAEHDVAGMALAIVQAPYIPRVTGFGLADAEKRLLVASNTLFDIGRMGEAYTAVAVMQLAEMGKLGLDDPIVRYLGDVAEAWRGVTLRHLLMHASGIADYARDPSFDPARSYAIGEIVALSATKPLAFAPGKDLADSRTDYKLLARIVELASGQTYRDFVRANQFERLGLSHTVFADETDRVRSEAVERNGNRHKEFLVDPALINPTERATGYRAVGEAQAPATAPPRLIDGPILASAMDISLWDVGLAGGILVKDAKLRALLYQPATLADGRKAPVMGAWRFPGRKGLMYVTGDERGFSAFLSRFTDASELVCVTLLANKEGLDLTQLGRRIAGAYDPRLGHPAAADGMRVQQSPYPVGETIQRLETALRAAGMGIMGRVDHAAGANKAGLSLPATEVLTFGDPRAGTLLMQARGAAALDLPLRAVAWEEDGQVWLGLTDPVDIARRYAIAGRDKLAHAMRRRLDTLALKAVTPY